MRILGVDCSLNHAGAVLIQGGLLKHFWYFTNIAGSAERSKKHGTRLPAKGKNIDNKDRQQYQMFRLIWVRNWLRAVVKVSKPDYIGIEDYAIRMEHGAHYMGEVGGAARMVFWDAGIPFRMSDPVSCKMFVTYDGTGQKDLVEKSVRERWNVDFSAFNGPPQKGKKANRQTSEDLADAFGLCKLVETEVQLRNGNIRLSDLHPKCVQVFNRITKTYPCNLLDREFIQNPVFRKAA